MQSARLHKSLEKGEQQGQNISFLISLGVMENESLQTLQIIGTYLFAYLNIYLAL